MENADSRPVLVIGASGKTGRRVVAGLEARGVAVEQASRSARRRFDWADSTSWPTALAGTRAAYVTYAPDLAVPGAPDAIAELAVLAEHACVEHLVLLSGRGEEQAQLAELKLIASPVEHTIVRASWFMQNFDEGEFAEGVVSGELALPAGDVPVPFIDADDIAEIVVAALTEPGHRGMVYDVTGPEALTFADAVAAIASATGRNVRYDQVPLDAWIDGARAAGLPDDIVGLLRYLFTEVVVESNSWVTDGVEKALGRPATDFATYAARVAASGVWSTP